MNFGNMARMGWLALGYPVTVSYIFGHETESVMMVTCLIGT